VSSTDFLPKADRSLSLRLRPFLLELSVSVMLMNSQAQVYIQVLASFLLL
jgi:hypothetical protein